MWRITPLFIAFYILLLASGVPAYLHHLQHEQEDAIADAALAAAPQSANPSTPEHHPHEHDESTCPLCAQFNAPMIAAAWSMIVLDTGERTYDLPSPPIGRPSQTFPARISCRGPPPSPSC